MPSNPQDCTTTSPQQLLLTPSHDVRDEKIVYKSPVSLASSNKVLAALRPPSSTTATGDCPICLEKLSRERFIHIQGCDHAYHFKCINDYMKHDLICPICRSPIGAPQGQSPSGTMSIKLDNNDCPGFPNTKTIVITYEIPSGMQHSYQENPGSSFSGTDSYDVSPKQRRWPSVADSSQVCILTRPDIPSGHVGNYRCK